MPIALEMGALFLETPGEGDDAASFARRGASRGVDEVGGGGFDEGGSKVQGETAEGGERGGWVFQDMTTEGVHLM